MNNMRGLIFDMDGVLLDTEKIYFQCWKQSAREFGFIMQDETALAVRSCCSKYAEPFLKHKMGESFDYFRVRNRRRELVSQYIAEKGIQQKPGILSLMQFCKEQGILTAVATATSHDLAEKRLQLAGLNHVFSKIIGGDNVSCGKPEPDIYLQAAAELGLSPKECIAIEDSPNGIISAFSAGCSVIMIPDLTPPDSYLQPILCDIAANLQQVKTILEIMKK